MAYVDLREFIARLEQEKEIIRVKTEVDIKYEMGAVCRHVLNAGGVEKNKVLFFEKPKGYSIPVAAGLLDSRNRYYLATVIWKSVPSIVKFDLSQKEGNQNGL